jgi:hypothetical protein
VTRRAARALLLTASLALALGSLQIALGQGPRYFREGIEAYQRRDFDVAIQRFTLAIEGGDLPHPDLFFAFNNRGNAYARRATTIARSPTSPRPRGSIRTTRTR